ncbi:hypothetical protein [Sphingomonas xinjiangensis]|uniref:Uncharacterized protein n=1 Tax=Sphingomonas xinjiangensis TaxID=643568 RepID=A0A840YSF2_9SPHN|nr:hypothetical protein [Sphingomonas xinjiangensis]MBB5712605.1 hypothetical protein [Sphingomonas xinjiangensis]
MNHDIDQQLLRIASADNPALDGIEDAVFARIQARRTSVGTGLGAAALAALGAVALGTMAAGSVATPASAAATLDPIGAVSSLAPSTLLLASR